MAGSRPFSELLDKMSPERRARADAKTQELLDQLENKKPPNELFVPGTVSCDTLRRQDLIPAFLDEIERLNPEVFNSMVSDPAYIASQEADDDSEWWDSEESGFFFDELFEKLNAEAPEGYYFGAHPGDGADYGFWPVSE